MRRIGYNSRPNINYAPLLAQIKAQGGADAHVFECYASELHRLRDFLPYVTLPIWRPMPSSAAWSSENIWSKIPAQVWTEERITELTAAGYQPGQVAIHLHNESGWSAEMLAWELRASQTAVNRGWSVVALNTSVGTPPQDQLFMAKDLLSYAAFHPDKVFIGTHEYFSVVGDRKIPWYIRRWSFWENYRKSVNIPDVLRYVITEFGAEDISDDHAYTDTLPHVSGKPIGGVHTLEPAWKHLYQQAYKSLGDQYWFEIKTAIESGLYEDKRIAGVCIFSWGVGGRWADYDVSAMTDLHGSIANWQKEAKPLEPNPEQAPVIAIATANDVRIRAAAVTGGVIGTVQQDQEVTVLENAANIGIQGQWLKLRTKSGLEGYSAAWFYKRKEAPPADPEPDPDDTTEIPPTYVTVAQFADALLRLQAAENKIEAQAAYINELETSITAAVIMNLVMRLNTPPVNIVKLKETG